MSHGGIILAIQNFPMNGECSFAKAFTEQRKQVYEVNMT